MAISKQRRPIEYTKVKLLLESGNFTVKNEAVVTVKKDDANQGATFVTLPSLPTPVAKQGRMVIVKDAKGDAAANNITVVGTVDGAANYVISENYGAVALIANGANGWGVAFQGLSVSSTELGYLNGITPGTATGNKALVVNAAKDIGTLGNVGVGGTLALSAVGAIAAAGTVVANATAIGANTVANVTGADDAKGVVLPAGTPGDVRLVFNNAAGNTLNLYAPVGGTLRANAANTATVLAAKAQAVCVCISANNWSATIS